MWQRGVSTAASASLLLTLPTGYRTASLPGLQATACDQRLTGSRNDPYGYHLRGDRCEGLFAREVAGDVRLVLVSLTQSFAKFDARSGEPLHIQWRAPANAGVRLRSYSLRRKLYYRMDTARRAGDASYEWPTTLLRDLGLSRDDIGIIGWITQPVGDTPRDVFVPLQVSQRTLPSEEPRVEAVILPSAELNEVFLSVARLRPDGGIAAQVERDRPLHLGFYPADRGIRVALPSLTMPGMYLVEIGATLRMGGSSTARFWLYHADE